MLLRANVEWWKARFRERVGNRYVYGGIFSPTNVKQGCDCSALAAHALNGVLFGPRMTWQRVDPTRGNAWITTESWRPIKTGQKGPFGTITVSRPEDIPADAAVKIALSHGPGGGANSHMWLEVDGVRMESAGSKGCCTQPYALPIDHRSGNDWAYLPGPIVEDGTEIIEPDRTVWGIDISNHQGVMDLDRVKSEGFDFIWCKVSEGANYRDPFWPANRDNAKKAGLILAGYHYIRTGDPLAQARTFVEHLGDRSIPAMLDFEDGSGDIGQFWAVKEAIESLGVKVKLSYIPDWYWERIGKPDLSEVPGLISSEYVSGSGYASAIYPGDNSSFWKPYGGRTPDILQFTDRALVAGKYVDANAYRGTPEKLKRLLGYGDDFLSALTDAEQRELLDLARQQAKYRRPSLSPLRHVGEGVVNTCAGFAWTADANIHVLLVERLAVAYKDPDAIALLKEVAYVDTDEHPDRAKDAELALRILSKVDNA